MIPLAALAVEGTAPEAGEEISLQAVTARIVSIEGDQARVEVVAINGQPIAGETPMSEDDEMRAMAEKADGAAY
jgi:exosome complex RNA-binding protein Csl4